MKRAITGFLSGIFLLGMVSQVQGFVIAVNASFADGGTVFGFIDYNPGGSSGYFVTDWNLTTTDGTIPGFNYTPGNSTLGLNKTGRTRFHEIGTERRLLLFWDPNLTATSTGPFTLGSDSREQLTLRGASRSVSRAGPVSTPEPGAILLIGSGLLGLGLWRYRRNLKS